MFNELSEGDMRGGSRLSGQTGTVKQLQRGLWGIGRVACRESRTVTLVSLENKPDLTDSLRRRTEGIIWTWFGAMIVEPVSRRRTVPEYPLDWHMPGQRALRGTAAVVDAVWNYGPVLAHCHGSETWVIGRTGFLFKVVPVLLWGVSTSGNGCKPDDVLWMLFASIFLCQRTFLAMLPPFKTQMHLTSNSCAAVFLISFGPFRSPEQHQERQVAHFQSLCDDSNADLVRVMLPVKHLCEPSLRCSQQQKLLVGHLYIKDHGAVKEWNRICIVDERFRLDASVEQLFAQVPPCSIRGLLAWRWQDFA